MYIYIYMIYIYIYIYIYHIYIHIMFGLSTMQSPVIRHLPSGEDFESVVLWFFPHPMKIKKRILCLKKTWFAKQILSYVA